MSTINDDLKLARFYGYVSDPNIVSVELEVEEVIGNRTETKTLQQDISDDSMFIFVWNEVTHDYEYNPILRGLDKERNILYENEF